MAKRKKDENPTAKSEGVVLPSTIEALQSSENLTRAEAERVLGGEDADTIRGERVTYFAAVTALPAGDEHPLIQADKIQARNAAEALAATGADPVIVGPTAMVIPEHSDIRKVEEGDKTEGEPAVTVSL